MRFWKKYAKEGCDERELDRDVVEYDRYGITINGILSYPDVNGFYENEIHKDTGTKYDEDGWDIDGYNNRGFNKDGIHKDTGTKYDKDGEKHEEPFDWNKDGFDKNDLE